jgi:hypothetical protein
MAVRNFWVEAEIDGRSTLLAGGPRANVGCMTVRVTMRDQGVIIPACTVECIPLEDGTLHVYIKTMRPTNVKLQNLDSWQTESNGITCLVVSKC